MNTIKYIKKVIGLIIPLLIIVGCAAPYKIMPPFEREERQLQTIALYPLHFSKDGKEERLFGLTFSDMFFDEVKGMNYTKPLQFILPDSTVSVFEKAGISVKSTVRGIVDKSDVSTEYPVYKRLSSSEFKAISNQVDGVIFCDLTSYNEVGSGEQLGQAVATACLTGGMVSASEQNRVRMKISLFSTKIDSVLWEYKPHLTKSLSGRESTRSSFSTDITNGFRKYFPLSKEFQPK
ncbi:hypothetical protein GF406_01180 [candidate division KSB1 bacterium]|nr:hypothetical protein [candidate division KSB1 bacterium]